MVPKKNPSKDVHRLYPALLSSGLIISLALIAMAFQWKAKKQPVTSCRFTTTEPVGIILESPLIVEKTEAIPKPVKKVQVIDLNQTKGTDNPFEADTFSLIPSELPAETSITPIVLTAPEPVVDTFLIVEKMPQPVGGYQHFYTFLSKAIHYPKLAQRNGTQGKVFVEFIIDKAGNVSNVKVIKGIGSGCDAEAARVVALTRWEPGKQRGTPVTVKMVMPVWFRLH
ncbi:MAG: energy transducer TonB [Flammeovirgaceae bacterium]|nr:MAG: energy transducer TonB [Flammeovirgaceae bacterium]